MDRKFCIVPYLIKWSTFNHTEKRIRILKKKTARERSLWMKLVTSSLRSWVYNKIEFLQIPQQSYQMVKKNFYQNILFNNLFVKKQEKHLFFYFTIFQQKRQEKRLFSKQERNQVLFRAGEIFQIFRVISTIYLKHDIFIFNFGKKAWQVVPLTPAIFVPNF